MKFFNKNKSGTQAKKISAWIKKENEDGTAWVLLQNQSSAPVFKIILSTVNVQGSPSDGRLAPPGCRAFLSIVPPGTYYTLLTINHGMHFISGVELSFLDNEGNAWLRDGAGHLTRLQKTPVEYYGLSIPLSWENPFTEINQ